MATFVERKSRLTIVKRLHGRDSQSMTQAVLELASQLQIQVFFGDLSEKFD
ncbi:Integrase catalytic region [Limosilactobacillus fermentum F-6]|nr:Integrase catalytic region [Limosilactobacillus fermentum F-6]